METPYLMRFCPIGNFFFGGSVSFSDGFYVQSERFPQPTTLLGAMRAALLVGNGLLVQHRRGRFVPPALKQTAAELTGTSAINHLEETPDLGVIQRLSPVFLLQTDDQGQPVDAFFPLPHDVVQTENNRFRRLGYTPIPAMVSNCGRKGSLAFCSDFSPKTEAGGDFLAGASFWRAYLDDQPLTQGILPPEDEKQGPFIPCSQVGIGLEQRRVARGRFYVKNEYRLKKGYCFGLIAWLADWQGEPPKTARTGVLGGEQSAFEFKRTAIDPEHSLFSDHPLLRGLLEGRAVMRAHGSNGPRKGVALSPLVVPGSDGFFSHLAHAVVRGVESVRMLNSIRLPKNGSPSPSHVRHGKKVLKSEAYRFIPAGSVFWFKDNGDFGPSVEIGGLIPRIGYNHLILCSSPTNQPLSL